MSGIDVEAFLKKWGSGANLDYRSELRDWMQRSYTNPQIFWSDLFSYSSDVHPASTTVVFDKYDFYSDCILRHLGQGLTALKVIDSTGAAQVWTYDEIHEYVEAQVLYWTENYGLKPGKTVALLLPYGIHLIVALMTALRLGLIVSLMPLKDRYIGEGMLPLIADTLKPDLIIAESSEGASPRKNVLELNLKLENSRAPSLESYAYPAAEIVFRHCNPHGEESLTTIEASRSYLIPLRDARIALNLKQSSCWARPFLSIYREEPCCTLMALLAGATLVHIADEDLLANPKALENETVHVLGDLPALNAALAQKPQLPVRKNQAVASEPPFWQRSQLAGVLRAQPLKQNTHVPALD